MADGQPDRLRKSQAGEAPWREGTLLALLRRVVAPRGAAVLVMEPDGRLVSARPDRPGERSLRSLW